MTTSSFNLSEGPDVGSPAKNIILLDSIPNLRQVDAHGKLFRSSRQDRATEADIQVICTNLGIRSFFDLRSAHEYRDIDGAKVKAIDRAIPVFVPDIPDSKSRKDCSTNSPSLKDLNGKPVSITKQSSKHRRYLISMVTKDGALEIFNMAPWYKRIFTVLCVLFGILMGNYYLYFTRCLSEEIKRHKLIGIYKGLMKYKSREICFVLKAISNPEYLPALLCCTYGKDRTGIIIALVLSMLGKSDKYIAEEYSLSEKGLEIIMPEVRKEVLKYIPDESFLQSKEETMLDLLATTRETYGSVENYLESIGFGKDNQNKLRQALS